MASKKNGSKLTRSQLSNAAAELNEVLEPDPPINAKAKKDELETKIKEAGGLIDPEADELTESTWGVLEKIGAAHRPAQEYVPQREEGGEEGGEETAQEPAQESAEEETPEQGGEDQAEELQEENAADTSASEDAAEPAQEPEPQKEKGNKSKSGKKPKEAKPQKSNKSMSRTEAVVSAFSENPEAIGNKDRLEEIVTRADEIYVNNGGKSNLKESRWATKLASNVLNLAKSYGLR